LKFLLLLVMEDRLSRYVKWQGMLVIVVVVIVTLAQLT